MLLIIQLVLYCLLFFLMVKAAVKDNGMNCLYFTRRLLSTKPSGAAWLTRTKR